MTWVVSCGSTLFPWFVFLICSSVVRVHDSQAYRKMGVTREHISRILELRGMFLSFQICFNIISAAVVYAILESISGLEPSQLLLRPSIEGQEHLSQFQNKTDALPCHIHLPLCLWIMATHSRAAKKITSHGSEVLPQDTTHLLQRPRYQRGSLCQDPEAIGPHGDFLTIGKRCKLKRYGHERDRGP